MERPLFSPREREVLEHLTIGRSNKVIARLMTIAESTVQDHVKSIFRKTGMKNRTQAALWAVGPGAFSVQSAHADAPTVEILTIDYPTPPIRGG